MHRQANRTIESWRLPNRLLPYEKPTYRRGDDGDTAIRVILPDIASSKTMSAKVACQPEDRIISLKRSFFTAFDAYEAQDEALQNLASDAYDRASTPPSSKLIKQRRDSMQDTPSLPSSQPTLDSVSPALPIPPVPTDVSKFYAAPQIVTPSTEEAPPKRESSTPVPKELEIDGNPGFDPHRDDQHVEDEADVVKTYLWKGKRYEVQGDEPPEWLNDVRNASRPAGRLSGGGLQPSRDQRSISTTGSVGSSRNGRTRQSLRSGLGEDAGRRRSSRRG